MNEPDSLWAQLDWDENGQPVSRQFGDVYFSKVNGMAESDYVFVKHNRLQERFGQLSTNAVFTIAETGFGSGLNFLCAWRVWEQFAPPGARLQFVSVEKYPLQLDELGRALALWPELAAKARALIENYPPVDIRGLHRIPLSKNIQLTLVFADAEAGLDSLLPIRHPGPRVAENSFGLSCFAHNGPVDAWFLDGFAPAKNPQMWQPGLFELMAKLSHPGTTFATFTAAGSVKRGLQQAGFDVTKVAGFGNKRDMLIGTRSAMPRTGEGAKRHKPDFSWHLTEANHPPPDRIAIIGAGLAGCHTARALAQRGFQVTLIDQHGIAAGASGNAQGVLYTKLSGQPSPLADFNLHAFLFAERFYSNSGLFTSAGQQTGVLQLAASIEQEVQLRSIAERFQLSPAFAQFQDAARASTTAGVELGYGGLLMPRAGWFDPAALCRALVEHANIEVWPGRPVHDLLWHEGKWELKDVQGQTFASYPCVVVACADSARRFTPCTLLQTKAIRGQVTHAQATAKSAQLRTVLTGAGYIAPAADGQHCLGASYDLHSTELTINLQDQRMNLQNVAAMSPDLADLEAYPTQEEEGVVLDSTQESDTAGRTSAGRTSLRCTTPDYLPMVGPVPQREVQLERFQSYRHNTKAVVDKLGCYWPGLLLNTGHGSKGLTYTPICAELVACLVTGEPLPLTRDLLLHLHPSRFLIRDLARRRV